jgi:UDP-N-acetylglucosamine--N-acetylmuramyl-(pentapeptide) pyrophosphoryl-undecaprenol N-acetylglucosamine transferase
VGTRHGLEAKVIPDKGFRLRTVWISGLHRGQIFQNVLFPVKMLVSFLQAIKICLDIKPDIVLGTGGYVSWPMLTAAVILQMKTSIQEQNLYPGLVTRLLAPFANSVHLSFEDSKQYFRKKTNLFVSGNPTRQSLELARRSDAYSLFGLDEGKKTLLIFGGSQGALPINRIFLSIIERILCIPCLQILWATGPRWYSGISDRVSEMKYVKTIPYIKEMGYAYTVSDVLVCRSGATTVAEVSRMGCVAVFIPLPTAAEGHQKKNAQILVQANAAEMVSQGPDAEETLLRLITSLITDKERRQQMSKNVKTFAKPDAAKSIVDQLLTL